MCCRLESCAGELQNSAVYNLVSRVDKYDLCATRCSAFLEEARWSGRPQKRRIGHALRSQHFPIETRIKQNSSKRGYPRRIRFETICRSNRTNQFQEALYCPVFTLRTDWTSQVFYHESRALLHSRLRSV